MGRPDLSRGRTNGHENSNVGLLGGRTTMKILAQGHEEEEQPWEQQIQARRAWCREEGMGDGKENGGFGKEIWQIACRKGGLWTTFSDSKHSHH